MMKREQIQGLFSEEGKDTSISSSWNEVLTIFQSRLLYTLSPKRNVFPAYKEQMSILFNSPQAIKCPK